MRLSLHSSSTQTVKSSQHRFSGLRKAFTETPSGPYNYEIELDDEGYEAIEVVGAYPYKQIGIFNEFYVNGVRYYANVTLRNTDQ